MADPMKKVQPGDALEIPAQTFNCFIDAAEDFKKRTLGFGQKNIPQVPQRTIIPVKNMSGAQRNRFDVLGLDSPLFPVTSDALKARPMMVGIEPALADHIGRFAVLLEPADVGAISRACVSGVTVARVNFSDASHEWADIGDGQCAHLESQAVPGGAYVIWPPGQTGEQLSIIRIGNPEAKYQRCTCKMKGTGGSGSKADCTVDNVKIISGRSPLDDPTDMAEELSAFNKLAWHFEDNAEAKIEWNETEGRWEVYNLERQARFITFSLSAALAKTSSSVSATVTGRWDGTGPSSGSITLYNVPAASNYIFEGASGAKGIARLNETNGNYYIVNMEC